MGKRIDRKIAFIWILVIAIASSKIFLGFDIDEQYALAMGYKLSNGQHLISEIWDPHQMSALFIIPIFKLMKMFDYEYIVVIIRTIGFALHLLVSYLLYSYFKDKIKYANLMAMMYFLILPKQTFMIEHSNLLNWTITLMVLCILNNFYKKSDIYLYGSSVFIAFAVLAYPTQLFLFPAVLAGLLYINYKSKDKKDSNIKLFIKFIMPSGIMFALFMAYLMSYLKLSEIIYFVSRIFLEGSHQVSALERITQTFMSFFVICGLISIFCLCASVFANKFFKWKLFSNLEVVDLFEVSSILFWPCSIITLFLLGRIWPPLAMYGRYLLIVLIFISLNKKYNRLVIYVPIIVAIISIITSNQGIDAASSYMGLAYAYSVAIILEKISVKNQNFVNLSIVVMLVGQLLLVGTSSRVTGTIPYPAYILKQTNVEELKTIGVTAEDSVLFDTLDKYKEFYEGKSMGYIGDNVLAYIILNAKIDAPYTISTPVHDNLWVEYYEMYGYPEIFLVQKDFFENLKVFSGNDLGKKIIEKGYKITSEDDIFMVMSK